MLSRLFLHRGGWFGETDVENSFPLALSSHPFPPHRFCLANQPRKREFLGPTGVFSHRLQQKTQKAFKKFRTKRATGKRLEFCGREAKKDLRGNQRVRHTSMHFLPPSSDPPRSFPLPPRAWVPRILSRNERNVDIPKRQTCLYLLGFLSQGTHPSVGYI